MEDVQPYTKKISCSNLSEYRGGSKFKNDDTLFARITPCLENGKIGFVNFLEEEEIGFGSTEFIVFRAKNDICSPDYLYYLTSSPDFRETAIASMTGSSGRQRVQISEISDYQLLLPPLPEQRAIAGVLSALDDKIDLLHRQNETLEALAQALFRHWFIEQAQDDWDEIKLSYFADHYRENIEPYNRPLEIFFHYSIPAFDDGKRPKREFGSEIRSNKFQVKENSILISKLNPRFPRVWPLPGEIDKNSICSTEFQVVVPKKDEYYPFVYYFLKSKEFSNNLISYASGTSGSHQRVKPEDIFNSSLLIANENQVINFSKSVSAFINKSFLNSNQIQTLENLRDLLLPKLISGQVRVRYDQPQ